MSTCLCMQSAILLWKICPSVRLSTCSSVILRYCIEMSAHIVKLFPPSGTAMTSLLSAGAVAKFQEELPQRGS